MSDVFTKRRPMIDWDEFERRLRRPSDQRDDDPFAELLRSYDGVGELAAAWPLGVVGPYSIMQNFTPNNDH
jgi:hypothetical protein